MSDIPKDKKEKKEKPQPKKSQTIPIPDPPAQISLSPSRPPPGFGAEPPALTVGSRQNRTYSLEQLLNLQDDPKLQDAKDLKLPDKINRKLLEPALRKRKYPFITESQRRKNGDGNQSRWENKNGKWRDNRTGGKGQKHAASIDEIEEQEELDEQRDPHEPDPDWADANEEDIKRQIKSFQFQALDREAEREMFAATGQVPDKPKLAKIVPQPKRKDEGNLDSLFRTAKVANMPQLPENAVEANQLEKRELGSSLFSRELGDPKARKDGDIPRPLGLFGFARDRGRNFTRPIGDHLGGRDHDSEYPRAVGVDPRRSPNVPTQEREEPNRITDFDLNKFTDPGATQEKAESNSPPHDTDQGGQDRDRPFPKPVTTISVKSNLDPGQRLENILYEVTDPVRPCVGGQFFAPARPLTNKELYDYSPKFKEIQDTRHKQIMRHSMQQQRKRIMMEKYAQAKRMYEKYPAPHPGRGYPSDPRDPRDRGGRMIDYRREQAAGGYPSDYEGYLKSHPRTNGRPGAMDYHQ